MHCDHDVTRRARPVHTAGTTDCLLCCTCRYALLFWTPLILYHILGAASKKKYVAEAGETMTEEQIEIGRDSVSEVRAACMCLHSDLMMLVEDHSLGQRPLSVTRASVNSPLRCEGGTGYGSCTTSVAGLTRHRRAASLKSPLLSDQKSRVLIA